jgi:hypothetical protein
VNKLRPDNTSDFDGLRSRDGQAVAHDVMEMDGEDGCPEPLEGAVSKRIGSRDVSGRTRAWLKTKNPTFSAAYDWP